VYGISLLCIVCVGVVFERLCWFTVAENKEGTNLGHSSMKKRSVSNEGQGKDERQTFAQLLTPTQMI
jgi:hypothetical protein